ncbi:hypothetical protein [Methylobacterium durans]|nr:hypothetical protein [Methylobacterium durans]
MADIRKQKTYDGCCTLYIGQQVIISDIDEAEADALTASFSRREG